jgi:mono/diheme cytochrome c family protein/heme/copper-type cytochrome/quinol oxidase subunit 4
MSDTAHTHDHDHDHDHSHDHDHGHGDDGHEGHVHSHTKLYVITAVVLSVITFIELIVVPDFWHFIFNGAVDELPNSVVVPSLYALAILKFAGVIGLFMHLKDDRKIYSLLFLSPLVIAVIVVSILGIFTVINYKPFSGETPGVMADFANQKDGFQETERMWRDAKQERPKPSTPEELQAAYTLSEQTSFSAGKNIYDKRCAACHRADGGGGIGPAFTDNCYKNGGTLTELATSIREGIPGTAMAPMKYEFSYPEIEQTAFYVRSLRDVKVEGGKACEGDAYTGE